MRAGRVAGEQKLAEGKPREVDGWVVRPLSTGLLGHSYASAVRPIDLLQTASLT